MWPHFVVELRVVVGPVFRHDARCRSQGSRLDITHTYGPAATRGGRHILNTISDNPADRKSGGETRPLTRRTHWTSRAGAGVPGCRTPIRSKGKQRFGAVSCRKRSIETQTAVIFPISRTRQRSRLLGGCGGRRCRYNRATQPHQLLRSATHDPGRRDLRDGLVNLNHNHRLHLAGDRPRGIAVIAEVENLQIWVG